jgi:putative DNA primase/helicase
MTELPSRQEIARKLCGDVRGNHVLVPGPNHSPIDRSLQITINPAAPDGFLVHSFAGDDDIACKDYIRQKLGLPEWKPSGRGNSGDDGNGHDRLRVVATYPYTDKCGGLLYEKVRYDPKRFSVRRPSGNGGWIWNLDGMPRVLYRLPELSEAVAQDRLIFIAEGEKEVDALVGLGVPATCSGGANSWDDRFAEDLKGASVIILPDNDEPGRNHAKRIVSSLTGVAANIRVVHLPRLPEGGDAYDWIEAGGTAGALWELVEIEAREWKPKAQQHGKTTEGSMLIYRCASEVSLEPIVWLWPGRIAKGKHTCFAGDPGTGKSQLAIAIAATISTGGEWPCGEGRAPLGSVIILSAEDGAGDTILPRLHAASADCGRVHLVDALREQSGGERTFNLKTDIAALEEMIVEIGDVTLVVIDTVNSYLGKTDSHKNAEVRQVLDPLSKMAERTAVAVVSITHFSKGGSNCTNKALHRFLGSIGFVGSPRAAFATFEDPGEPERRLFLHAKNNLAPPPLGLAYRLAQTIVGKPGQGIVASRVEWEPNHVKTRRTSWRRCWPMVP